MFTILGFNGRSMYPIYPNFQTFSFYFCCTWRKRKSWATNRVRLDYYFIEIIDKLKCFFKFNHIFTPLIIFENQTTPCTEEFNYFYHLLAVISIDLESSIETASAFRKCWIYVNQYLIEIILLLGFFLKFHLFLSMKEIGGAPPRFNLHFHN